MRKSTAALAAAAAIVLTPGVSAQAVEVPSVVSAETSSSTGDSTADDQATDEVKETTEEAKDGFDWGWLGLLGLAGLAGLAGRNRREPVAHHTTDVRRDVHTTNTTRGAGSHSATDVNRDGRTDVRDVTDRDGDGRIG